MDIDGTIADATERFKKAGPEPKQRGKHYSAWLKKIQNKKLLALDSKVRGMLTLCDGLSQSKYIHLIYLTGRSEIYREVTLDWLSYHDFPLGGYGSLIMRPKGNRQRNGDLKETLIKQRLKNDSVNNNSPVLVIDDDQCGDIEEMCHKNGYTFLKARSGSL